MRVSVKVIECRERSYDRAPPNARQNAHARAHTHAHACSNTNGFSCEQSQSIDEKKSRKRPAESEEIIHKSRAVVIHLNLQPSTLIHTH